MKGYEYDTNRRKTTKINRGGEIVDKILLDEDDIRLITLKNKIERQIEKHTHLMKYFRLMRRKFWRLMRREYMTLQRLERKKKRLEERLKKP